ncbi:FMN-binding protein [Candidatus Xianfuyuplasma coldseepsis]|uniref:FMN-binding protein n=1 Tax=Candidatus Xianfuyuplasma coldseepsis TaxID=2782163 RepID=A0A7L7KPI4_9MOLU|nr:FMN-binding protein [Xianfuyuplasma coldseepsis]QMS84465.1 FMN-binding protein [Xianfuyuplasma coldseepsis]
MKPLKIVFMLFITVVGLSLAVFVVEGFTSEEIARRKAEEMKEIIDSLSDIFPAMEPTYQVETAEPTSDAATAGITSILEITDSSGNAVGYVYFVTFRGYASNLEYMMSVDAEGNIGGFEMLSQAESASTADEFMSPDLWAQFSGMSIQLAGSGDFDGVAGATFTTGYWKTSMQSVYNYHLDTYGFTPLTPEQVKMKKLEALAGGTITEYTPTNPFDSYGITSIYTTDGDAVVVYEASFVGFNGDDENQYAIAYDTTTNEVLGYITLYSGDTAEYGAEKMYDETLWSQFDGNLSTDMTGVSVDTFGGASVTGLAFESSLQLVALYHRWEFEGEKELTYNERVDKAFDELFASATEYVDVTGGKLTNPLIEGVYDAYNGNTYLGTVYHMITIGASYSEITYIEFMVGIDADDNFTGLQFIDTTDTKNRVEGYYDDAYDTSMIGDAITAELDLDEVGGATITFAQVRDAVEILVDYHINKYPLFEVPGDTSIANLQTVYPDAITFESVYTTYSYDSNILNLYAAKDGSDAIIGYVYYATFEGFADDITYLLSVDLSDTIVQFMVISQNDTPGYGGQIADAANWTQFIDLAFLDAANGDFDGLSGATVTTTAWKASIADIYDYHTSESVGGAN